MYFKRKAYDKLIEWKLNYADSYAVLLEGARRVGESTIAKLFAENEYKSYILIDFSIASTDILSCFDEVQLFPRARQAIKHLVKDGRYHYIETSIKKNVKDILIPSEEMKITVYPMDYEEFCNATGNNYHLIKQLFDMKKAVGQEVNRKLMRDMRIYMAVGGMLQAV